MNENAKRDENNQATMLGVTELWEIKNVKVTETWEIKTDSWPVGEFVIVTPSDSAVIDTTTALFIWTWWDVAVYNGTASVVFKNIADGSILPVKTTKVYLTGTTASDIIALY